MGSPVGAYRDVDGTVVCGFVGGRNALLGDEQVELEGHIPHPTSPLQFLDCWMCRLISEELTVLRTGCAGFGSLSLVRASGCRIFYRDWCGDLCEADSH